MTKEEKDNLYRRVNEAVIEPSEPMNLMEIKAYVKGCEYAYITFLDAIDKAYRETKNGLGKSGGICT